MGKNKAHVEKIIVEEDKEISLKSTYTVQKEHSYSKNYKLFKQKHIPDCNTNTTKTDSVFPCKSCKLYFTTLEQLDNHIVWCKEKNKPDGEMFKNYLNKNLKKEIIEIDNYENQTVEIKQKIKNIEQAPIDIKNIVEKFEIKKEINEEFIIKDEQFDTIDGTFECESCKLGFTFVEQLNNHTFWCKEKNKPDGIMFNVDYLNKNLKEEVFEIDNYDNYKTVEIKQKKKNIELAPIKIEDTLGKFEVKQEINEELIIKSEKLNTDDNIFECETCKSVFESEIQLISHTFGCKRNKRSIETADQTENDYTSIYRSIFKGRKPKTNAEKCRDYRNRNKLEKNRRAAKRMQAYRLRQKMILQESGTHLSVLPSVSSNSDMCIVTPGPLCQPPPAAINEMMSNNIVNQIGDNICNSSLSTPTQNYHNVITVQTEIHMQNSPSLYNHITTRNLPLTATERSRRCRERKKQQLAEASNLQDNRNVITLQTENYMQNSSPIYNHLTTKKVALTAAERVRRYRAKKRSSN